MSRHSVIVIGAGLGGLQCAYILQRNGFDVTVLEQGGHIGGCLQTFSRRGTQFDTGFHYVGGLGEGQVLEWMFKYFNLMDLPWRKMDEDCVDRIVIGDRQFSLPQGYDRFVDSLSREFPSQKKELRQYVRTLKAVGESLKADFGSGASMEYFSQGAYKFLCDTISDPLLRQVLSGAALRLDSSADLLPLYEFAQINNSFIQSGWRLEGGGGTLVERLAEEIIRMGGKILTGRKVTELFESGGTVLEAICEDGESFEADIFISDAHPAVTVALLKNSSSLKSIYRKRINALKNSYGVFTLNAKIKEEALPYVNYNTTIHSANADIWHSRGRSYMISYGVPSSGSSATTIDVLTRMDWNLVSEWEGTSPMLRGEEYEAVKENLARRCIKAAERVIPSFEKSIDFYTTSTSLTYNDYVSSPCGSAFGVSKDWHSPITTVLSPQTPVRNLLMTGQSLNLHGIMGVSMTSLYTCANIIGIEKIKKQFKI